MIDITSSSTFYKCPNSTEPAKDVFFKDKLTELDDK